MKPGGATYFETFTMKGGGHTTPLFIFKELIFNPD
jgi:hypothetical protein